MGARKQKLETCTACGAGFRPGPAACPLCGAELAVAPAEPDGYQEAVRALREELKRLRADGAA